MPLLPPITAGLMGPQTSISMLLFVDVLLKDVFEQGRDFQWPTPACCPNCSHYKVWRHGFVERFFDLFAKALLIRRFRCPQCRCVICCRPASHFSRIRASKIFIRECLSMRLLSGRWPPGSSLSRYRHWLSNLKRKTVAHFGMECTHDLLAAYDSLLMQGHLPVCRSL